MQWPWKRAISKDQFIVSWFAQELAYVQASREEDRVTIKRMGVEALGTNTLKDFAARLASAGLAGGNAIAMLTTSQCMLLQIAAPAVPPEELRAAVRYQIRDMVDMHIDDLTLDVLHVGDSQDKASDQLFVVAASNAVVRETMQLAESMDWSCRIIDVQELAHRNLQSAWSKAAGFADRATAALFVVDDKHALLTITAQEELYYSRRLELPVDFLTMQWDGGASKHEEAIDAYTPVDEYIPDYGSPVVTKAGEDPLGGNDRAQRLLVEVQRSLDLWDRTRTNLPMAAIGVYAGSRTDELAAWLGRGLGQPVVNLDPTKLFEGVPHLSDQHSMQCLPLLGLLLRTGGNA